MRSACETTRLFLHLCGSLHKNILRQTFWDHLISWMEKQERWIFKKKRTLFKRFYDNWKQILKVNTIFKKIKLLNNTPPSHDFHLFQGASIFTSFTSLTIVLWSGKGQNLSYKNQSHFLQKSQKEAKNHKHCSYSKFFLPFDFICVLHFQMKHLKMHIEATLYQYYSIKKTIWNQKIQKLYIKKHKYSE